MGMHGEYADSNAVQTDADPAQVWCKLSPTLSFDETCTPFTVQ
jgi:hypothetical protein